MMRRLWPRVYLRTGAVAHHDRPSTPADSGSVYPDPTPIVSAVGSFQHIITVFPPSGASAAPVLLACYYTQPRDTGSTPLERAGPGSLGMLGPAGAPTHQLV